MHVYSIITIVNHDLESMRETREEVSMHGESACLYLCYMLVDTCMCGMGRLGLALQPVFSTQSPTFSLFPHPTFSHTSPFNHNPSTFSHNVRAPM
jgi:hypothetical protein